MEENNQNNVMNDEALEQVNGGTWLPIITCAPYYVAYIGPDPKDHNPGPFCSDEPNKGCKEDCRTCEMKPEMRI